MTWDALILVAGLALLLGGGDLVVRGASALAASLGVSALVVGLTVVAFGTSAPELAVNLTAALQGNTDICFGNIVGSNIANVGLVLGCAALIRPLTIHDGIISREIPMMLLASAWAWVAGSDRLLRAQSAFFDRSDGAVALLLFLVFLYYTVSDALRQRASDPLLKQAASATPAPGRLSPLLSLLLCLGGVMGLVAGGKLAVYGAVALAEALQVSKAVIGLTVVAIGTSLPELVTSVLAAWKGHTDLAVGNVVGSNIFNLLFINGVTAALRPIAVPSAGGRYDLLAMLFLSSLLLPLAITDDKRLVRWEGALLLVLYAGFGATRLLMR